MEFKSQVEHSCHQVLNSASPIRPVLVAAISRRRANLQAIIKELNEGSVSPAKLDALLSEEVNKVANVLIEQSNLSQFEAKQKSEKAIFTLAKRLM